MTSSNSLFVDLSGDQFLRLIFTHFQGFIRSSIQGVIEDSSHQNGNIYFQLLCQCGKLRFIGVHVMQNLIPCDG